ncbi:FtsX-like permease family protein [Streptomyces panaciradicis]|uniref:FtsX-like permease family protein n=1 Tax=Streptomyces panaciradicis TaxID=1470261 RepID=UPI00201CFDF6|nr:FtsX-like permease family protein [Streptomyces panaciradicis]MCL6673999.1 ABC transporter permease [Streptomyces panaciradicis]
MLLFAASVPTVRDHRDQRIHHRIDVNLSDRAITRSDHTVLVRDIDTVFRGEKIRGRMVQPEGPAAPLPPGVHRYPRPGEMVVSPALHKLLTTRANGLLRERLAHPIAGEISGAGLLDPGEHVFYLVSNHMAADAGQTRRLDHFGKAYPKKPLPPELILLCIAGIVVLLVPVGTFIAAAVRFGGERRDRRLAALRLVGADRGMTATIAAGEVGLSTVAGIALGAVLFMTGRQFAEAVEIQGLGVFTQDLTPHPLLAALVVVAVLTLALGITQLSMHNVAVEPLGVVRTSGSASRRLWWRIALPLLGLILLRISVRSPADLHGTSGVVLVLIGMLSLLVGVTAVLPWVVERLTRRFSGFGPLPWQLALRGLQLNGEAATRSVNGIAVAVAGAVALQTLVTGLSHNPVDGTAPAARNPSASTRVAIARLDDHGTRGAQYAAVLAASPGVQQAVEFEELSVSPVNGGFPQTVLIADCAHLRLLAQLPSCSDGDAFLTAPSGTDAKHDMTTWAVGMKLRMGMYGPRWTVPHITTTARATRAYPAAGSSERTLLATPGAAGPTAIAHAVSTVGLTYATGFKDVQDHIRTAAARLDPAFSVDFPGKSQGNPALDGIRRALLAGVTAVLVLIAVSMLLDALEQVRERGRVLSVLVAFGTPRRTLAISVLLQSVLPVGLGLLVAESIGTALGSTLLDLVGKPVPHNWRMLLTIAGIGAAVSLGVTLLTLPTLWRSTQPQGLRHE